LRSGSGSDLGCKANGSKLKEVKGIKSGKIKESTLIELTGEVIERFDLFLGLQALLKEVSDKTRVIEE